MRPKKGHETGMPPNLSQEERTRKIELSESRKREKAKLRARKYRIRRKGVSPRISFSSEAEKLQNSREKTKRRVQNWRLKKKMTA
jgi:hypothetical protein